MRSMAKTIRLNGTELPPVEMAHWRNVLRYDRGEPSGRTTDFELLGVTKACVRVRASDPLGRPFEFDSRRRAGSTP